MVVDKNEFFKSLLKYAKTRLDKFDSFEGPVYEIYKNLIGELI